jgi:hypothetical protein
VSPSVRLEGAVEPALAIVAPSPRRRHKRPGRPTKLSPIVTEKVEHLEDATGSLIPLLLPALGAGALAIIVVRGRRA